MLAAVIGESSKIFTLLIASTNNTRSLVIPNNVSHFLGILIMLIGAYLGNLKGVVIALIINKIIIFVWYATLVKNKYQRL